MTSSHTLPYTKTLWQKSTHHKNSKGSLGGGEKQKKLNKSVEPREFLEDIRGVGKTNPPFMSNPLLIQFSREAICAFSVLELQNYEADETPLL